MSKFGFLVDYEFCVGCRACEIACNQEHKRSAERWGINVIEIVQQGRQYYFPFITDRCNFCAQRLKQGHKPACVQSCWAGVMRFEEIQKLSDVKNIKAKTVILIPH